MNLAVSPNAQEPMYRQIYEQIAGQILSGALRAGAALVIAGLAAEGITTIDDIVYIQRGYENFEGKLQQLGARIEKVSSDREARKFLLNVG